MVGMPQHQQQTLGSSAGGYAASPPGGMAIPEGTPGAGGMPPLFYNNATSGIPPGGAGNIDPQNQLQQHHSLEPLVPPSAVSTPWTLGSTDGSFAMQLALLEQQREQHQEQQEQQQLTAATASTASPTSSTENSHNSNSNKNQQQKQQRVSAGGAAIAPSGEASRASNSTVNSVSSSTTDESNRAQQQRLYSERLAVLSAKRSLFQDRLFRQPSASVESVLAASCEVMGFDIAEMWLRTGAKTHQLTNSHLRPTALDDSVRKDLVDVYYGEKSSERTHRLSPALCKRAKEANDVVWVTAHTSHGAEALRCSISNVRTAVAVPICHEASNTNITIIFFSIRRYSVTRALPDFCPIVSRTYHNPNSHHALNYLFWCAE